MVDLGLCFTASTAEGSPNQAAGMAADMARASVELIRVQLRTGKPADAYETAMKMPRLVKPLENEPAAQAAVTELLRVALTGQGMTPGLVDRVATALDRGSAGRGGSRLAA